MAMVTTTVSPARPSMPSVRLTALLVPATIMMAKIMKAIWEAKSPTPTGCSIRDPRPKKGRFNTNAVGCSMSPRGPPVRLLRSQMPVEKNPHQDRQAHLEESPHIRKPSLDPSLARGELQPIIKAPQQGQEQGGGHGEVHQAHADRRRARREHQRTNDENPTHGCARFFLSQGIEVTVVGLGQIPDLFGPQPCKTEGAARTRRQTKTANAIRNSVFCIRRIRP